jgi:hypothetical protein
MFLLFCIYLVYVVHSWFSCLNMCMCYLCNYLSGSGNSKCININSVVVAAAFVVVVVVVLLLLLWTMQNDCLEQLQGRPSLLFNRARSLGAFYSSPFHADVKNEWSYTFTVPTCFHSLCMNNFTLFTWHAYIYMYVSRVDYLTFE